jgi:glycosyltransferase involved in cell wall biosynthesis
MLPATVVVPTRDRPDSLARCLEALAAQSLAGLEVVVVDDGSVVPVPAPPGARLVRLPGLGAAAARNAGARAERALDGEGTTTFAPSNNLACRADVARAVRFDESFVGAGGEDRDWCARVVAAGHRFVPVPGAVVRHRPPLTPSGYWRQQARYGAASSRFRRLSGAPVAEGPGFYVGLLRRGFERGAAVGSLVLLAQAAAAAGVLGDRISARRSAPHSGGEAR